MNFKDKKYYKEKIKEIALMMLLGISTSFILALIAVVFS